MVGMLRDGTIAQLVVLLIISAIITFSIKRGKLDLKIKKIAAIDALDEAVGRAAEMGRPVHFSTGGGNLSDDAAMQTVAGLSILRALAQKTAQYNVGLVCTIYAPEVQALTEDIVRTAYVAEGKADRYTPNMVRFISDQQGAYMAGTCSVLANEKVAASILAGAWFYEAWPVAETGALLGAFQIGGTARMAQLPTFVASCNYVFLGEEMFVAGAYLAKDPGLLGSIQGQDIAKLVILALVVCLTALSPFGVDFLVKALRM